MKMKMKMKMEMKMKMRKMREVTRIERRIFQSSAMMLSRLILSFRYIISFFPHSF
jgi:hypothetical protein